MNPAGCEPSVPRMLKPGSVHFGWWANFPCMANGAKDLIAAPGSHGRRPQRLLRCGRRLVNVGAGRLTTAMVFEGVRSHGAQAFDA